MSESIDGSREDGFPYGRPPGFGFIEQDDDTDEQPPLHIADMPRYVGPQELHRATYQQQGMLVDPRYAGMIEPLKVSLPIELPFSDEPMTQYSRVDKVLPEDAAFLARMSAASRRPAFDLADPLFKIVLDKRATAEMPGHGNPEQHTPPAIEQPPQKGEQS